MFKLKVLLGAGLYPDYFTLNENNRDYELTQIMKSFNPLTTVYFNNLPRENAYTYAKDIKLQMEKCGNVSRIYIKVSYPISYSLQ